MVQEAVRDALVSGGFSIEDILFAENANRAPVYNLRVPVTPLVLLFPRSSQHVSAAVKVAKSFGLKIQARSGGHSHASYSLGGADGHMIVDMKYLKDLHIDKETWRATVGPGLRLDELAWTLHDNVGRMIPQGTCGSVCVGGHATTGGMGPCTREYGLMLDSIREMEVVTAEGDILRINNEQNADLFWAMRGAGASFGIAAEFTFETYPEPASTVAFDFSFVAKSPAQIAPIMKKWQRFVLNPHLSPKFATIAFFGDSSCHIVGNYRASLEEFDELGFEDIFKDQPLKYQRNVAVCSWVDAVMPKAGNFYDQIPENETTAQEALKLMAAGFPSAFVSKTMIVKESHPMPDETIDEWFNYMANTDSGTTSWLTLVECSNGLVNSIATDATAYGHRDTLFVAQSLVWDTSDERPNGDTQCVKWATGIDEIMKRAMAQSPWGIYTGYVDAATDKTRYWGTNYPRLEELKKKWDPRNLFANPQSVGPGLG